MEEKLAMEKPTNLKDLNTELKKHYETMHTSMKVDDDWYNQVTSVAGMFVPLEIPIHFPSTATNIVDNMRDQVGTDEPVIEFSTLSNDENELAWGVTMARWGLDRFEWIRNWSLQDAFEQAKQDLLLRGAGVIKISINEEVLPDPPMRSEFKGKGSKEAFNEAVRAYEAKKQLNEPFIVRAIDPLDIMIAPGSLTRPSYVLEHQIRRVVDMSTEYPTWPDPYKKELIEAGNEFDANNPLREVEWLEYYSAEHYIVTVDGETIIDMPNPYGFVPYIWEYSGLGRSHSDGDPGHLARGLLSTIHGELQAEVRVKTAWDAQWQYHVFPTLLVKKAAEAAAKQMSVGPGRIMEWGILGDEKPEFLTVPPPDENMIVFLERIEQAISRQTATVLSDPGSSGSEFGILEALKIGQALKAVQPVIKTLNRMGAQTLGIMARLSKVRNLSFTVKVSGGNKKTITGDRFKDFDHFKVDFESIDAAENDRRMLIGSNLYTHELITKRTFHKKFGKSIVDDPDEEMQWMIVEGIVKQMMESGMILEIAMQQMREGQEEGGGLSGQVSSAVGPEQGAFPGLQNMMTEAVGGEGVGGATAPIQEGGQAMSEAPRAGGI